MNTVGIRGGMVKETGTTITKTPCTTWKKTRKFPFSYPNSNGSLSTVGGACSLPTADSKTLLDKHYATRIRWYSVATGHGRPNLSGWGITAVSTTTQSRQQQTGRRNDTSKTGGTLYSIPKGRRTAYPTGKPVELYRQLLQPPVIEDGEALLEPFCGSAPGAAVALERGLDYVGTDISEEAVELAWDRLRG